MSAVLPAPSKRQAVPTAVYNGFKCCHTHSTADSMRLFVQLTAAIQARCRAVTGPKSAGRSCFTVLFVLYTAYVSSSVMCSQFMPQPLALLLLKEQSAAGIGRI